MHNPWAARARLTWQKQRCAAVSGPRSSPWPERSNHKAPKRPTSKPQPRPIAARRPQPAPTSPAPGRRPRARRRSPRAAPPRPAPPLAPPSALPPPLRTCGGAHLCPREPRAPAFQLAPLTHPPTGHLACKLHPRGDAVLPGSGRPRSHCSRSSLSCPTQPLVTTRKSSLGLRVRRAPAA